MTDSVKIFPPGIVDKLQDNIEQIKTEVAQVSETIKESVVDASRHGADSAKAVAHTIAETGERVFESGQSTFSSYYTGGRRRLAVTAQMIRDNPLKSFYVGIAIGGCLMYLFR